MCHGHRTTEYMKDNADSDAAPYHSCKKRKYKSIDKGIAASCTQGVAVSFCFGVIKGSSSCEKEAAIYNNCKGMDSRVMFS